MATADLITSFLNNEMNADQERKFLLSVAASDSLRLELKSHVMLDRILNDQVHSAQVSPAVRQMIFAEASLATGVTPETQTPAVVHRPISGFFSRIQRGALAVLVMASSFALGYVASSENPDVATQAPAGGTRPAGSVGNAAPSVSRPDAPTLVKENRDPAIGSEATSIRESSRSDASRLASEAATNNARRPERSVGAVERAAQSQPNSVTAGTPPEKADEGRKVVSPANGVSATVKIVRPSEEEGTEKDSQGNQQGHQNAGSQEAAPR